MIGHKTILKQNEMIMIAKMFGTYVFPENLGLSLGKYIVL
jgi:hypothetical protein